MSEESPPEEAKRLKAFIGEWRVSGEMIEGANRFPISGRWSFSEAINGWGVKGKMLTSIEGMGSFEEEELIGLDAVAGLIHLVSMNRITIRDHVGGWNDRGALVTSYESENDGELTTETISVRFPEADRMEGTVIEQVDGVTVLETELQLQKEASTAKRG
jgi:hypothetical protein